MIYILLVLFGLVVGSFVGAVSYRIPRKLGFVKGRSFCDNCKKELRWFDNIPLASFLLYKGKSRCCKHLISIRYPIIETISTIGILVLYFYFPSFYEFVVYYLLFVLTLIITVIDFEHQIIPNELPFAIFVLFLLSYFFIFNQQLLFNSLFFAFLSASLILLIHLVTKGKGMGLGDVKLTIALGLWLSLQKNIMFLTYSFIIGGIVAVILLLLNKANLKTKVAFGPFLIIGFWFVMLT